MDKINQRIKLIESTESSRAELRKNKEGYNPVRIIEERPQEIERPCYLEFNKYGRVRPPKKPASIETQLQAWVVEHAVMRNFVPRLEDGHLPPEPAFKTAELEKITDPEDLLKLKFKDNLSEQTTARRAALEKLAKSICGDLSPEAQEEQIRAAMNLYVISRGKVGPVVADFADWCLKKTQPDQRILFLARDALGAYLAAKILIRKKGSPAIKDDQLQYVHISRKLLCNEEPATIKRYLSQYGVKDDEEDLLMVDVGIYGATHRYLKNLYGEKKLKSLFLISAADPGEFEGYLYDSHKPGPELSKIWRSISGNKAVHFMEDTFSGFYGTLKSLKEENGKLVPELERPYSRSVYLKRMAALLGIIDAAHYYEAGLKAGENKKELEEYLEHGFKKDASFVTVPHE